MRTAFLLAVFAIGGVLAGTVVDPAVLDACPGYSASNVKVEGGTLTASLKLAGKACNVFGTDIAALQLEVVYETTNRIHVKITDPTSARYEVPDSVLPRPSSAQPVSPSSAAIQFNYTASPFTFSILRSRTSEVLFSTKSHPIIYEPQYLRVKTSLPSNANIYGLGEHTNNFRLDPDNTTLTLWSRDAYGVPTGTNLYGNHPVYIEHRNTGTHAVFLLNSNGMDIKLTEGALEYNVIGGILDFYFLAGSETDPTEAARQYAEIVGTPAEVPYWSFGLHQCRFGYQNYIDVAGVISNYSAAGIPLETMWTDISLYLEPDYFPLTRMREIVDYLHSHDQRFILMTDPAVGYFPNSSYGPFDRGSADGVFLKNANGSDHLGLVWAGVSVWPDWFNDNAQDYWTTEFSIFYNKDTGLDIDGSWIDMFCDIPCTDPFQQAINQDLPPARTTAPPPPDAPIFGNPAPRKRDLLVPQYSINNAAPGGNLSSKTAYSSLSFSPMSSNAPSRYGTTMSVATHLAMLARRPGLRTLVITRSTFAGAGKHVGKWLGDNFSDWDHYKNSIAGMLGMATIYQVPMVGADICGYAEDTTEILCARWAMLGAFYPFMRNHNADTSISQEFYRWPLTTQAAKNALDMRYRLLDYFYTAFHQANQTGSPVVSPLWFKYPKDTNTYPIDVQWFYGDSILVSPVTEENSTSVSIYLPNDIFYDFPHSDARVQDFEFVVAPGVDGTASGQLYVDDGVSIEQSAETEVEMSFVGKTLKVTGSFGFETGVNTARVRFLGVSKAPGSILLNGQAVARQGVSYNQATQVLDVSVGLPLTKGFTVTLV
ncbi:alpha-glucosidase [Roridomyces roridus]|uniref:beta-glucosidase n=1 Tax=Roridomyces roridus TaxID=1738132 RepID=A0AAD7B6U9_9AGAR|nr:alpha-glucosidase [Roridomyces roridus]